MILREKTNRKGEMKFFCSELRCGENRLRIFTECACTLTYKMDGLSMYHRSLWIFQVDFLFILHFSFAFSRRIFPFLIVLPLGTLSISKLQVYSLKKFSEQHLVSPYLNTYSHSVILYFFTKSSPTISVPANISP